MCKIGYTLSNNKSKKYVKKYIMIKQKTEIYVKPMILLTGKNKSEKYIYY